MRGGGDYDIVLANLYDSATVTVYDESKTTVKAVYKYRPNNSHEMRFFVDYSDVVEISNLRRAGFVNPGVYDGFENQSFFVSGTSGTYYINHYYGDEWITNDKLGVDGIVSSYRFKKLNDSHGTVRIETVWNGSDTYTLLDYIECTGTQYIDTEFNPVGGMKAEFVANCGADVFPVLSALDADGSSVSRNWCVITGGYWQVGSGNGTLLNYTAEHGRLNEKVSVKFSTVPNNIYMILNGDCVISSTSNATNSPKSNAMIFTNSYDINRNNPSMKGRLYSMKIWDKDGNLIREYAPVRNDKTGEVGLWDYISQKFFGNAGTGKFIAG